MCIVRHSRALRIRKILENHCSQFPIGSRALYLGLICTFTIGFMITPFAVGNSWESLHYQEVLYRTICNLDISHDVSDDTNIPKMLRRTFPYPLTGFSFQLYTSVGKVESLCRLYHQGDAWTESSRQYLEQKARSVETELLDLVQVCQPNFEDPQDPNTSLDEILGVGEAYRFAGLLQLYSTFPRLLHQTKTTPTSETRSSFDALSDMDFDNPSSCKEFTPSQYNWLRALAIHILRILVRIPASSGTRVIQGLPVLIAASWLVDPLTTHQVHVASLDQPHIHTILPHPRLTVEESSFSKDHWRRLVRKGLQEHNEYVGLQQVLRILEIVEEVWRLDDLGFKKCQWMEIVASKGLQTLYG